MVSYSYFGLRQTPWTLLVLIFIVESVMGNFAKSFYIHWNSTNSIFRIDNTDHVFDLNKGNAQFEYDQVNIICPFYTPGTFEDDTEKYIIYNVSKEEYDTCRITNPNPRIIAICDKPHKLMYFTITFRPFTPQPGGLEFLPGKDYYFISTSSKDDLHRRIGGRCLSHNMKLGVRVCSMVEQGQAPAPQTHLPTTFPSTTTTITTVKPVTKKTHEYDKSPNDVVKSEELSYSRGAALASSIALAFAA
ncbi:ephrin-A4-like, partial [Pieris brassicae]|uniref:ephrin-A4-like n=1 Tax=Pieris brassicae TaxID=7116 RepID=UPI001E660AE7